MPKNKNPLFTLFVLSFLFLFLTPSQALARMRRNNYIVGKLGAYTPESSDLSGFDSGFTGEFDIGRYLNRNFAVEGGFGYLETYLPAVFYFNQNQFFPEDDIDATYLEATAKAVFPIPLYYAYARPAINLYAGAGLGVYFAHESIDGPSADDTVAGFHVLGGGDFNVNRRFFVGPEFKYIFARPDLVFGKTSLDGFIFTINFGYRF